MLLIHKTADIPDYCHIFDWNLTILFGKKYKKYIMRLNIMKYIMRLSMRLWWYISAWYREKKPLQLLSIILSIIQRWESIRWTMGECLQLSREVRRWFFSGASSPGARFSGARSHHPLSFPLRICSSSFPATYITLTSHPLVEPRKRNRWVIGMEEIWLRENIRFKERKFKWAHWAFAI